MINLPQFVRKTSLAVVVALLGIVAVPTLLQAQGSDHYGSGVVVKLNDNGSKFLRLITWHQVWTRYMEHNPGSFINLAPTASSWDIGLRRSRFLILGKLSEDVMILSHFGINNQTISTGGVGAPGRTNDNPNEDAKKPQLFLHDAWVEYRVTGGAKPTDDGLFIGTGLHYYNGLSRLSMASTLNFMAIDAPIYNWTTIDAGDQFARMMGIYAKGKALGFDYSFAFDMPFRYGATSTFTQIRTDSAAIAANGGALSVSNYSARAVNGMFKGYVAYELFDKENKTLPFTVGSYVGTKKVLNIGVGFQHQPKGMWTSSATINQGVVTRDTSDVAITNIAADAFLDLPLSSEKDPDAITAYGAFYNLNFGKNYIRSIGIMNPATSVTPGKSFNGAGDNMPTIGTGSIIYGEVGYVLPGRHGIFSDGAFSKMRIQPYAAVTHASFEALKDSYIMPEAGVNFYLDGHNAKLTLHYKARPVFDVAKNFMESKPEVITQAMVYF